MEEEISNDYSNLPEQNDNSHQQEDSVNKTDISCDSNDNCGSNENNNEVINDNDDTSKTFSDIYNTTLISSPDNFHNNNDEGDTVGIGETHPGKKIVDVEDSEKRKTDESFQVRDELDFEAEKESGEESDGCGDGEEKNDKSSPVNREEGEVSDEGDEDPSSRQEPKTVCRFFNKGQCTWGTNCRFLHPGVSDKGNYNMFASNRLQQQAQQDKEEDEEENATAKEKQQPRDVRPAAAAAPEPTTAFESAWERGLRQAKDMVKRANKRRETDADFEEKRFNLSLGQAELDRENDYYTRPASPVYKAPPSSGPDEFVDYLDPYERQAIKHFRGGHFENIEVRYKVGSSFRHHHHGDDLTPSGGGVSVRSRRGKFEREVSGRVPRRAAHLHPGESPHKIVKEKRYPRPEDWGHDDEDGLLVGPRATMTVMKEAESWADPWARRRTPVVEKGPGATTVASLGRRVKKKMKSRTRSYSSGSSSGSSKSSSRSTSYSSYSGSRSRSSSGGRGGSRSSLSRSSSRSLGGGRSPPPSPIHPRMHHHQHERGGLLIRGPRGRGGGGGLGGGRGRGGGGFGMPNFPYPPHLHHHPHPHHPHPHHPHYGGYPPNQPPPGHHPFHPHHDWGRAPIGVDQMNPHHHPRKDLGRDGGSNRFDIFGQRNFDQQQQQQQGRGGAPPHPQRTTNQRGSQQDTEDRVDMFGRTIRKDVPKSPVRRSKSPSRGHGRRKFSLTPSGSGSSSGSDSDSRSGGSRSYSRSYSRSRSKSSSSPSSPPPPSRLLPPTSSSSLAAKRKVQDRSRRPMGGQGGTVAYGESAKPKAVDVAKMSGQKQQIKASASSSSSSSLKRSSKHETSTKVINVDDDSGESDTDARILKKRKIDESSASSKQTASFSSSAAAAPSRAGGRHPRVPSPSAIASMTTGGAGAKKPTAARREELLKQLRAVEDAIARKRSKPLP